jgi:hypothetical protein
MMDKWQDGTGIGKETGISMKALKFENRPFNFQQFSHCLVHRLSNV